MNGSVDAHILVAGYHLICDVSFLGVSLTSKNSSLNAPCSGSSLVHLDLRYRQLQQSDQYHEGWTIKNVLVVLSGVQGEILHLNFGNKKSFGQGFKR